MREIGIPIGSQSFLSSSIDALVVVEQNNWAHEPTDLTYAYAFQPLIQEGDLAVAREEIAVPVKKGNATETKRARGSETIGGGLTINASIADGTPLLLAMYTQTLEPEWNILGGTGQVLPSSVNVVANTADLSSVAAQTVADDLVSTTNPVQLAINPVGDQVSVVNAQNVAPGTAVTIADDLGSTGTDIEGNLPVTVSLDSAALTSATVPGTITIVYDDQAGMAQTTVFTFANDVLATPQVMTLDIDEVTSVTPAGFSAGTVSVTATNPNSVTLASGVVVASIEVWGTDASDNQIVEEVEFTNSTKLASQTTDLYFKTVTDVYAANAATHQLVATGGARTAGWSDGNFSITARDTAVLAIFRPQDDEVVRYWAIEYAKGGRPATYYGLVPTTITFAISRDATRTDTLTFLGRRGEPGQNLAKEGIVYDPGGSTTYPQKTDISTLELSDPNVYVGWQAYLSLDGVIQPLIDCTFTMEQGLIDSNINSGEIYNVGPPVRDALRMLTISATVQDSRQMDYWGVFRNGRTIPNCRIIFRNNAYGAFAAQEAWIFEKVQITASVDPATSGQSRITVSLEIMAFSDEFGDPNDYRVEAHLPRYVAPRTYALSA